MALGGYVRAQNGNVGTMLPRTRHPVNQNTEKP